MANFIITYISESGDMRSETVEAESVHQVHDEPRDGEVLYSIFRVKD